MNDEPANYHAYLLRLWRTETCGQARWHASLESPHTREHLTFASLERCFAFLCAELPKHLGAQVPKCLMTGIRISTLYSPQWRTL